MNITWVTRSFLDYRIPVYKALDDLCCRHLTVIYNGDVVPQRCQEKLRSVLGERAIALSGEIRLSGVAKDNATMANKGYRIPFQRGLIKAIRSTNPDILVSDGFFQWTYSTLWVRMFNRRRIKHIMCYERTAHTERNAGFLRTMYRKVVSHWIDAIDCNGQLTAEYVVNVLNYNKLLAYGHMTAEIEGVAKRVDSASISTANEIKRKFDLTGLTFLYLGQLIQRKGIMELLEAWKEAGLSEASMMLVGDGKQRNEIQSYIDSNRIDNVKLLGSINYDNLGPYYKVADCFIIPTLEDNWSLVVPEAMAADLPVACSIYNGCHPELVRPSNGWTFDPLNKESIVRTLRQISDSRDKLKSMGEESRRIVANYTPRHAAQGIYDVCVTLLNKSK